MLEYFLICLIPLAVFLIVIKVIFGKEYSFGEFVVQLVGSTFIILLLTVIGYNSQTTDYKLVNGNVIKKEIIQKSCPFGWNDYTDSFCTEYHTRQVVSGMSCSTINKVTTCHNTYKTQYKYWYPWEKKYKVYSDVSSFEISRVDSQGANVPQRYSSVNIGDPVSTYTSYTNYVMASKMSLFNAGEKIDEKFSVKYPEIYNYYKVDRFIDVDGVYTVDERKKWSEQISEFNSRAKSKKANFIVVVTKSDETFASKLEQNWFSYKLNDVIVIIGIDDSKNIKWTNVKSWSKDETPTILIRDFILKQKKLNDPVLISISIAASINDTYVETPEQEFEYLKYDITPPLWCLILTMIFVAVVNPIIAMILTKNERF